MKDAVVIKSYAKGISLILNPDCTFEEILSEIGDKFRQGKDFFKDSTMPLSIEGKILTADEELKIVDTIYSNCDMKVLCIIGKDENEKNFVRAIEQLTDKLDKEDSGQFFRGTLKDGQIIESSKTVIVLGDVNPGCTVISTKNIIVLGGLYGEAFAGDNNENNHFVLALEMEPERLRIGDYKYKPQKPSRWGIHQKIQPKVAYIKEEEIVLENPSRNLLSRFL